ncbi:MAG: hypothetical protein QM820_32540 [Minicystis sp.]
MKGRIGGALRIGLIGAVGGMMFTNSALAAQPDPYASNNQVYPTAKEWSGGFRASNFDYPTKPLIAQWRPGGPTGRLTPANAAAYVAAVKKFLAPEMAGLVNDPQNWSPEKAGWYDMPWGAQGKTLPNGQINPDSGREALLGSYTGQILQPDSYPSNPPAIPFQNHAVVYYNDVAGHQLGKIWKDPFKPDLSAAQFPEGSIVVKAEAVTLDESQWPVLKGSSVSYIYRPDMASPKAETDPAKRRPVVTPMRFLQMAVRIKDKVASPVTGWVFIAFAYDARSGGATVWDRTIPVGATWGNDPDQANTPDGLAAGGKLQETWVDDGLPQFILDGLGWGGRLSGPLDLGIRHNVMTVSGKRYGDGNPNVPKSLASSACVSCHGAAQYPFVANLYPSPNMVFPKEGEPFLMYDPGTAKWAQWFQNRSGEQALSGDELVATDYDMMLTFALMNANRAADTDAFIRRPPAGHRRLGKTSTPIGPIVMMRGALRFVAAIAVLDELGPDKLWSLAKILSEALGLPLPGVSP